MNTYKKPGNVMTHAHTSPVVSGEPILVGDQVVVACGKYAANEEGEYLRGGVHSLKKKAATAIGKNVKVYWDNTAKEFNVTSSGNTLAGLCDTAAAADDAEVLILLNGIPYKYS